MKTLISRKTVNIVILFVLSLFLAGSPVFAEAWTCFALALK